MSLPEVLLTLGRHRRRQAQYLVDQCFSTAFAAGGAAGVKAFSAAIMESTNSPDEQQSPADIARSLGIPQAQ